MFPYSTLTYLRAQFKSRVIFVAGVGFNSELLPLFDVNLQKRIDTSDGVPLGIYVHLDNPLYAGTDYVADISIYIFMIAVAGTDIVTAHDLAITPGCGTVTSGIVPSLYNHQLTNTCSNRYNAPDGFKYLINFPVECVPSPQPKFARYTMASGYTLPNADLNSYMLAGNLSYTCFQATSQDYGTTFHMLENIALPEAPKASYTYVATTYSLDLHPLSPSVEYVTTVSTVLQISLSQTLDSLSYVSFLAAASSFDLSAAVSSNCTVVAKTTTTLKMMFPLTGYVAGEMFSFACQITGIQIVFANSAVRVTSTVPYIMLANSLQMRVNMESGSGVPNAAGNINVYANAPNAFWSVVQTNRVMSSFYAPTLVPDLSLMFKVFVLFPAPTLESIIIALSSNTTLCPDFAISQSTGATSTSASEYRVLSLARLTSFKSTSTSAFLATHSCFTFTSLTSSTNGALTYMQSTPNKLFLIDQYTASKPVEFSIHPMVMTMNSATDAATTSFGSAIMDVMFEITMYFHTAVSGYSYTLITDSSFGSLIKFSAASAQLGTVTAGKTTYTNCVLSFVNESALAFNSCDPVVADAGYNYRYESRSIRFGPITMLRSTYVSMYTNYTSGAAFKLVYSSLTQSMLNSDFDSSVLDPLENVPQYNVALYSKYIQASTFTNITSNPPSLMTKSHHSYIVKVFLARRAMTITMSDILLTNIGTASSISSTSTCSSITSSKLTACSVVASNLMEYTFYQLYITIPFESTTFAAANSKITFNVTYFVIMSSLLYPTPQSARVSAVVLYPLNSLNQPFAYDLRLAGAAWSGSDIVADLYLFVYPLAADILTPFLLTFNTDCGVFQATTNITLFNQQSTTTCDARYTFGFQNLTLPAACMGLPQPLYAGFRLGQAYKLANALSSSYVTAGVIPQTCFNMTSSASSAYILNPVSAVPFPNLPPKNYFYYDITFTRDSSAAQQRLQLDLRLVMTEVVTETSAALYIVIDTTTAGCSQYNSFYATTMTLQGPATLGCAASAALTSSLAVTCSFSAGKVVPGDAFSFGFKHVVQPSSTSSPASLDLEPTIPASCLAVEWRKNTNVYKGVAVRPAFSTAAHFSTSISYALASDVSKYGAGLQYMLQLTLYDFKMTPNHPFVYMLSLPVDCDYDFSYFDSTTYVVSFSWRITYISPRVVEFSQENASSGFYLTTTVSNMRFPVTRRYDSIYAGVNPFNILTMSSREIATGTIRVHALPPLTLPAPLTQTIDLYSSSVQDTFLTSNSSSITSSSTTLTNYTRGYTVYFSLSYTVPGPFQQLLYVQLPTVSFDYSLADYSFYYPGFASAYVAVPADAIIKFAIPTAMYNNTDCRIFVRKMIPTKTTTVRREAVILSIMDKRMTSYGGSTATYPARVLSLGYSSSALTTAIAVSLASTGTSVRASVYKVDPCTRVTDPSTTDFTIKCTVWPLGMTDYFAQDISFRSMMRPGNAAVDQTLATLTFIRADRIWPSASPAPCVPTNAGDLVVPMAACYADITHTSPKFEIIYSMSFLPINQYIELQIYKHNFGDIMMSFIIDPVAGPIFDLPYSNFSFAAPDLTSATSNLVPMSLTVAPPFWNANSTTYAVEFAIEGGNNGVYIRGGPVFRFVAVNGTECSISCAPLDANPINTNFYKRYLCALWTACTPATPTWTISSTNIAYSGAISSERARLRISIQAEWLLSGEKRTVYQTTIALPAPMSPPMSPPILSSLIITSSQSYFTLSPSICSRGDMIAETNDIVRLTLPPSSRTAGRFPLLSTGFSFRTLNESSTPSYTYPSATVSSPLRSFSFPITSAVMQACQDGISMSVISMTGPHYYEPGEQILVELLDPAGSCRAASALTVPAIFPTYSTGGMPLSFTTLTYMNRDISYATVSLSSTYTATRTAASEMEIRVSFGPECFFSPHVSKGALDLTYYAAVVKIPADAAPPAGSFAAAALARAPYRSIPVPTVSVMPDNSTSTGVKIPGVICVYGSTVTATVEFYASPLASTPLTRVSGNVSTSGFTSTGGLVRVINVNYHALGSYPTGIFAPELATYPGPNSATPFDVMMQVSFFHGVPPGFNVEFVFNWCLLSGLDTARLYDPEVGAFLPMSAYTYTPFATARRGSFLLPDGWPSGAPLNMLISNVSVDVSSLTSGSLVTISVVRVQFTDSNSLMHATNSYTPFPMRTDWTVDFATAAVNLIPHAPTGSNYGRGFDLSLTFSVSAPMSLSTSIGSYVRVSFKIPEYIGLTDAQAKLLVPTRTSWLQQSYTCGGAGPYLITGSFDWGLSPIDMSDASNTTTLAGTSRTRYVTFRANVYYGTTLSVPAGTECVFNFAGYYTKSLSSTFRDFALRNPAVLTFKYLMSSNSYFYQREVAISPAASDVAATPSIAPFTSVTLRWASFPQHVAQTTAFPLAGSDWGYLSRARIVPLVGPRYDFFPRSGAKNTEGYAGLGPEFAMVVPVKVSAVAPAAATGLCVTLPVGVSTLLSPTSELLFHVVGKTGVSSWAAEAATVKLCSATGLPAAAVALSHGAGLVLSPVSGGSFSLADLVPTNCLCTSSMPATMANRTATDTVLIGVSGLRIASYNGLMSEEPLARAALFSLFLTSNSNTVVVPGTLSSVPSQPPARNRIFAPTW